MQAKNGFAFSLRRHIRLMCAAGLVLALSALAFASPASAKIKPTQTYFALGDSLSFGYSKQLANENEKAGEPPTAYEHGFTNAYLHLEKPSINHIQLTNNGCPGETSGGVIGTGPLGAALAGSALKAEPEPSCEYHNLAGLPLHHEYGTGKSQLENAVETIAVDSFTGVPVTTISLQIGANDQLHAVAKCEKEAKPTEEAAFIKALTEGKSVKEAEEAAAAAGKTYVENCIAKEAPATFKHILTNQAAILFTLREGAKFGGVNYAGKIILVGNYDPYGAVFVPEEELLTLSTLLTRSLNQHMETEVAPPFGACFANPYSMFNPGGKGEPNRLQKYTNMANFTEFEGKKNGPDIHPTPEGYKKYANAMFKACG